MNVPQKIRLPGITTVFGVLSGKGGVGKTFITGNLAILFAKLGKKVGVLDADISCPNLFRVLGITAKVIPTADNKFIPLEKCGVKAMSMAGLCGSEDEAIAWRGPILSKIIQQFLKETVWGELDLLLIDFPTGTSDTAITILQNFEIDGVILVTTPQELSTIDCRKAANVASLLKVPVLGLIENMRGEVFGEGGGNRTAEVLRIPFLGSIPIRKQIVASCDRGEPAIDQMEELNIIFTRVARTLLSRIPVG